MNHKYSTLLETINFLRKARNHKFSTLSGSKCLTGTVYYTYDFEANKNLYQKQSVLFMDRKKSLWTQSKYFVSEIFILFNDWSKSKSLFVGQWILIFEAKSRPKLKDSLTFHDNRNFARAFWDSQV